MEGNKAGMIGVFIKIPGWFWFGHKLSNRESLTNINHLLSVVCSRRKFFNHYELHNKRGDNRLLFKDNLLLRYDRHDLGAFTESQQPPYHAGGTGEEVYGMYFIGCVQEFLYKS